MALLSVTFVLPIIFFLGSESLPVAHLPESTTKPNEEAPGNLDIVSSNAESLSIYRAQVELPKQKSNNANRDQLATIQPSLQNNVSEKTATSEQGAYRKNSSQPEATSEQSLLALFKYRGSFAPTWFFQNSMVNVINIFMPMLKRTNSTPQEIIQVVSEPSVQATLNSTEQDNAAGQTKLKTIAENDGVELYSTILSALPTKAKMHTEDNEPTSPTLILSSPTEKLLSLDGAMPNLPSSKVFTESSTDSTPDSGTSTKIDADGLQKSKTKDLTQSEHLVTEDTLYVDKTTESSENTDGSDENKTADSGLLEQKPEEFDPKILTALPKEASTHPENNEQISPTLILSTSTEKSLSSDGVMPKLPTSVDSTLSDGSWTQHDAEISQKSKTNDMTQSTPLATSAAVFLLDKTPESSENKDGTGLGANKTAESHLKGKPKEVDPKIPTTFPTKASTHAEDNEPTFPMLMPSSLSEKSLTPDGAFPNFPSSTDSTPDSGTSTEHDAGSLQKSKTKELTQSESLETDDTLSVDKTTESSENTVGTDDTLSVDKTTESSENTVGTDDTLSVDKTTESSENTVGTDDTLSVVKTTESSENTVGADDTLSVDKTTESSENTVGMGSGANETADSLLEKPKERDPRILTALPKGASTQAEVKELTLPALIVSSSTEKAMSLDGAMPHIPLSTDSTLGRGTSTKPDADGLQNSKTKELPQSESLVTDDTLSVDETESSENTVRIESDANETADSRLHEEKPEELHPTILTALLNESTHAEDNEPTLPTLMLSSSTEKSLSPDGAMPNILSSTDSSLGKGTSTEDAADSLLKSKTKDLTQSTPLVTDVFSYDKTTESSENTDEMVSDANNIVESPLLEEKPKELDPAVIATELPMKENAHAEDTEPTLSSLSSFSPTKKVLPLGGTTPNVPFSADSTLGIGTSTEIIVASYDASGEDFNGPLPTDSNLLVSNSTNVRLFPAKPEASPPVLGGVTLPVVKTTISTTEENVTDFDDFERTNSSEKESRRVKTILVVPDPVDSTTKGDASIQTLEERDIAARLELSDSTTNAGVLRNSKENSLGEKTPATSNVKTSDSEGMEDENSSAGKTPAIEVGTTQTPDTGKENAIATEQQEQSDLTTVSADLGYRSYSTEETLIYGKVETSDAPVSEMDTMREDETVATTQLKQIDLTTIIVGFEDKNSSTEGPSVKSNVETSKSPELEVDLKEDKTFAISELKQSDSTVIATASENNKFSSEGPAINVKAQTSDLPDSEVDDKSEDKSIATTPKLESTTIASVLTGESYSTESPISEEVTIASILAGKSYSTKETPISEVTTLDVPMSGIGDMGEDKTVATTQTKQINLTNIAVSFEDVRVSTEESSVKSSVSTEESTVKSSVSTEESLVKSSVSTEESFVKSSVSTEESFVKSSVSTEESSIKSNVETTDFPRPGKGNLKEGNSSETAEFEHSDSTNAVALEEKGFSEEESAINDKAKTTDRPDPEKSGLSEDNSTTITQLEKINSTTIAGVLEDIDFSTETPGIGAVEISDSLELGTGNMTEDKTIPTTQSNEIDYTSKTVEDVEGDKNSDTNRLVNGNVETKLPQSDKGDLIEENNTAITQLEQSDSTSTPRVLREEIPAKTLLNITEKASEFVDSPNVLPISKEQSFSGDQTENSVGDLLSTLAHEQHESSILQVMSLETSSPVKESRITGMENGTYTISDSETTAFTVDISEHYTTESGVERSTNATRLLPAPAEGFPLLLKEEDPKKHTRGSADFQPSTPSGLSPVHSETSPTTEEMTKDTLIDNSVDTTGFEPSSSTDFVPNFAQTENLPSSEFIGSSSTHKNKSISQLMVGVVDHADSDSSGVEAEHEFSELSTVSSLLKDNRFFRTLRNLVESLNEYGSEEAHVYPGDMEYGVELDHSP